jgi:hypothetical protein
MWVNIACFIVGAMFGLFIAAVLALSHGFSEEDTGLER